MREADCTALGVVLLVHTALNRAEELARHWSAAGCPLVIHVDKSVPAQDHERFIHALADLPALRFSRRRRCEWGSWGIVAATQDAAQLMLDSFPEVRHVYLASGACLPLRPVPELCAYLDTRPDTDFIESATTADVPWTVGGLDRERFTLRFPFSWRRHRYLFDRYVALQRRLGVRRRIPEGLVPHLGSQWWCLTRQTLSAILEDPARARHDRYFRKVWIPDESYFQTLARRYSRRIESRSLTLSKFDHQGKPHIFYDDHLQLLRRSDCFVARKVWPFADGLYRAFLTGRAQAMNPTEPNPGKIDRIFAKADERRLTGRPGLFMQSRFPAHAQESGLTCGPYSVFEGFDDLFGNFMPWLARTSGARVHGHLFARAGAEFCDGQRVMTGALSASAALRDENPEAFLANLVWNTRGERQCFQFGPRDRQAIGDYMARDANAQISVISGAWAVPLFRSNRNFRDIRRMAARMQRIESRHIELLRARWTRAQVRIWTMADFLEAPMEILQSILEESGLQNAQGPAEAPALVDLTGFGQFLQNLKNQGMHPYLMGDFPVADEVPPPRRIPRKKPYLVR